MMIRELRVDELETLAAFAQEAGVTLAAETVDARRSLVAIEDGQWAGAVAAVGRAYRERYLQLLLGKGHRDDEAAAKRLMDKAMVKVRSQGAGTARIMPDPRMEAVDFWDALAWVFETLGETRKATGAAQAGCGV